MAATAATAASAGAANHSAEAAAAAVLDLTLPVFTHHVRMAREQVQSLSLAALAAFAGLVLLSYLSVIRIPRWLLPAGVTTSKGASEWPDSRTRDKTRAAGETMDKHGIKLKYYDCGNSFSGDDAARANVTVPQQLKFWAVVLVAGIAGQGQVLTLPVLVLHMVGVDLPYLLEAAAGDWRFVAAYMALSAVGAAHGYYKHCAKIEAWKAAERAEGRGAMWETQPGKRLSPKLTAEARVLGTFNAGVAGVLGMATLLLHLHGGYTVLYFDVAQYGLPYYLLSWIIHFVWIETFAYTSHIFFHSTFIYSTFHKVHHRYQPPTAFSAVAFHPVEFALYVLFGQTIFFFVPIHPTVMLVVGMYTAIHLIEDHTGIQKTPVWPWQPTSHFHDDHHAFFHCNYGQHSIWFDYLFGTLRKSGKVYKE